MDPNILRKSYKNEIMDHNSFEEFISYAERYNKKTTPFKWAEVRPIPEAFFDDQGQVVSRPNSTLPLLPREIAISTRSMPKRNNSVTSMMSHGLKSIVTEVTNNESNAQANAGSPNEGTQPRQLKKPPPPFNISSSSSSSSDTATADIKEPRVDQSLLIQSSMSAASSSSHGVYATNTGHTNDQRGPYSSALGISQSADSKDIEGVVAEGAHVTVSLESFPACPGDENLTHELLNKLVILKLNGGLGTSMGCKGAKSALEVRGGLTFLDLTVRQVEYLNVKFGVDVPLILMNSFNTHEETELLISRYESHNITIHTMMQNCFPCVNKATQRIIPNRPLDESSKGDWYPPGHGDVYSTLKKSGYLEKLVSQGKTWIFISNIDNLGATVDMNLLYHLMCNNHTFCMEVTSKQPQDVAGGALVIYEGKPKLVELSSVPEKYAETFRRIHNFKMFNTNNLWVDLRFLQSLMSTKPILELEVFARELKRNDQHDLVSIQLETRAGSAIQFFESALAVQVSRERFIPVKTTSDLFVVQSNLYTVKHGRLSLNPQRTLNPPVPTVKLGPCYVNIDEYQRRLQGGVPDILELVHLTVSGDVVFQGLVTLRGTVIIVAEQGSHIDVAKGTVLEDVVMTGNLRIIEA